MVKKIISYEKTAYNKPWFYDMVAIAGDTYPEYQNPDWAGNEGEIYADMAIENMTGFNPIKLYTSNETLKSWKDMKSAINNGCGFLYFVGHGSATSWSTHFPNSKNWTEGFTVSHFHGEAGYECWGWRMTRKIGGGSIATIGCSALGFTKEDKVSFKGGINELEVEFFKAYGQNNIDVIGDTWKAALDWYVSTYSINWEEELSNDSWVDIQVPSTWTLIGDPSLKIGGYPSAIV